MIIFGCLAGSYMYGTFTPSSDLDTRQVEIESVEYILGLQRKDHTVITGEKDETTFTLRFFAKLALENNPNILELIYVKQADASWWSTDWGEFVTVAREYIPSQLVSKTFGGYAVSQLKRIEGHYRWLNSDAPKNPRPEDYGRVVTFTGEKWTDYQLKQEYDADKKRYDQYQTWIKNRNPVRSELEKKYGYDSKHAMHLVRLITEAQHLLTAGYLEFPLPNSEWLREVRNGYFSYSDLIKYADDSLKYIETMETNLPKKPNFEKVQEVIIDIYRRYI